MIIRIMPLCSEIKLFHVHNPRCAGSAINKALYNAGYLKLNSLNPKDVDLERFYGVGNIDGEKLELDHLSISQILSRLNSKQIQNIHFFSTVRDPWDRFVSDFLRKKQRNDKRFINPTNLDLKEYLEIFLKKIVDKELFVRNQFDAAHFWPQEWFAEFSIHPDIKRYSILRFEELENEWENFQYKFGFNAPLPARKINASLPESKKISEDLKKTDLFKLFKDFYANDYKIFGYD